MDDQLLTLYSRQILMPNMGIEAQQQLLDSTVLIVGAGGLGNTVAQYLFGSGVGRLLMVDNDVVEYSNLPRQVLFNAADVGLSKAQVLCQRLTQRLTQSAAQQSTQTVSEAADCVAFHEVFSEDLMQRLKRDYAIDAIVDAGDNLPLSYQLDEVASREGLPLIHASVSRFEGHCYTRLPRAEFPTLKKLFPNTAERETCSQSGVLTAAVGLMGSYQATSVLRVLLAAKLGEIKPELVLFDGLSMRFMPLSLQET